MSKGHRFNLSYSALLLSLTTICMIIGLYVLLYTERILIGIGICISGFVSGISVVFTIIKRKQHGVY